MHEVKIQDIPRMHALTIPHAGAYMQIDRAFDRLFNTLTAKNALRPGMRMIAIYYDDPTSVPEEKLRSAAGVVYQETPPPDISLDHTEVGGGPHAVLRHKGPYAELQSSYDWLFGHWLPQSGREAADAPVFEEYLNTPRDTAPPDLITDIYLPLRSQSQ